MGSKIRIYTKFYLHTKFFKELFKFSSILFEHFF